MNKLTKILSAIALASAVSAGMVLMAGCEGCSDTTTPPPGGEQHEHTYSPDWSCDENNHWHAATCEHSDLKSDEAAHVDANNDGVCDVCDYDQMPITPYAVGIEMTKTAKEYVLDGSTTAAVALDDIKVNTVLSDGTDGETVTEYAMYGYKGAEPLQAEGKTLTAADVSALGAGAYNIWVEAEIDSNGTNKKVESFVIVYVVDELISIQFNAEAAGTVTTQEAGTTDLMSPTWTFTATFKSGATLPLTADDVKIDNVKTTSATDAGVANIYYEYTNAKGELEKQETTVNYTVTAPQTGGETQVNNYAFSYEELTAALTVNGVAPADKTALSADKFTGSNAFLTFIADGSGSSDQYRTSGGGCIEIKGDRLQVTFLGTGTITLTVSSTGGSNNSRFGIKDASGAYIPASVSTGATAVADGEDAGTYEVTGTAYVTLTFEVSEAGVYTICAPSGTTTRGGRIQTITMVDTVGGSGTVVTDNYSFSYSELTAALTVEGVAPADKTALSADKFTGSNAFLTFIADGSGSSDQYRTSGGGCIEIKGDRLQVTFLGTGTITLTVSSTGGSNNSRFGIKDASGAYIPASVSTGATAVADGEDAGTYEVTGTAYVTLTFEVSEAGVYTICAPSGTTTRGGRIQTITMVDTH